MQIKIDKSELTKQLNADRYSFNRGGEYPRQRELPLS